MIIEKSIAPHAGTYSYVSNSDRYFEFLLQKVSVYVYIGTTGSYPNDILSDVIHRWGWQTAIAILIRKNGLSGYETARFNLIGQ